MQGGMTLVWLGNGCWLVRAQTSASSARAEADARACRFRLANDKHCVPCSSPEHPRRLTGAWQYHLALGSTHKRRLSAPKPTHGQARLAA